MRRDNGHWSPVGRAHSNQTVLALEARVRQQIAVAEFSQRALECRTLSKLFEEATLIGAIIVEVEFYEILELLLLSEQSLLMIAAYTGRPLKFTQCSDSRFGGGLEVAVCVHYLSL